MFVYKPIQSFFLSPSPSSSSYPSASSYSTYTGGSFQ